MFISAVPAQTEALNLQTPQRFLQRFLERPPDRHRLADTFHPRRQRRVRLGKFLKREPRHFYDAVIDGWFKACRRLARNIILDLIERVTHCEFCRDFCNRKPRRFRSQRARTRHTRIHLDHNHPAVVGINSKLNVRTASLDANLANDGE